MSPPPLVSSDLSPEDWVIRAVADVALYPEIAVLHLLSYSVARINRWSFSDTGRALDKTPHLGQVKTEGGSSTDGATMKRRPVPGRWQSS